jgi:hypothetical protein
MKRKRHSDDVGSRTETRKEIYTRDELLLITMQLVLQYNVEFKVPSNNLTIYQYAKSINEIETIVKLNMVLRACIQTGISKSIENIREIIETPINA